MLAGRSWATMEGMRWALLVLFAGCGGAPGPAPHGIEYTRNGQETALQIISHEFGRHAGAVPIYWVEGDALDCNGGAGFSVGPGRCVDGTFDMGSGAAMIAWRCHEGSCDNWASVSLAHELCHATFGDADHRGACAGDSEMLARTARALTEAFPEMPAPPWSAP